jgi:hypothetical protein
MREETCSLRWLLLVCGDKQSLPGPLLHYPSPSLHYVNLLCVDRIRIETGVAPAMNTTLHFRSTAPPPHTHTKIPIHLMPPPPPRHDTRTKHAPFMYIKSLIPIALKVQIHSTHINANYVWVSVYCIFTTVSPLSSFQGHTTHITDRRLVYDEILNLCFNMCKLRRLKAGKYKWKTLLL